MNLKAFFKKINSWENYVKAQDKLNSKEKGDTFELLTKIYFSISPQYNFYDNVWLLEEVPEKILEEIGLPRQDLGVDLIAKYEDEYHAIQCKYHSDKYRSVTYKEVSTFLSAIAQCDQITCGYICSTANITTKNYEKVPKKPIYKVLADTWENLTTDFFKNLNLELKRKPLKFTIYKPKQHQKKAINEGIEYFKNNSRGKLIFPCGSGKSLTGFWITREFKSMNILIAVPSLALIKQTLDVYLGQIVARKEKVKWLCICSDDGIGKSDDVALLTEDVGVPCVTDSDYISSWLKRNKDDQKIIFTTYQSGKLIAEISKKQKLFFDLGIFDEAHKTVGSEKSLFSHLLFEKNINVKKRVFMTATERFYLGSKDDIVSMDNPDIYGEVFSKMTFKEAIKKDLLTDYKIITLDIKKSEVLDFIKKNGLIQLSSKWKNEPDARSLASMIALRKAMENYPINNAVSFHSSIEKAKRNKDIHKYITDNYGYNPITTYTVSGKQLTSVRNDIVSEFAKTKKALITNARCLTEGIDVPNIDCIVFADPKKSKIDIVQALGRALRKKTGKEFGYVILPIEYDENNEIDNESFNNLITIIRGLAGNDERIIDYFKTKTDSEGGGNHIEGSDSLFEMISESDLIEQIEIKVWDNLSKFRIRDFDEARDFARSLNLYGMKEWLKAYKNGDIPKDIPIYPDGQTYRDKWKGWFDWLGNEDRHPKNVAEKGIEEIKKYIKINGNSYIKNTYQTDDGFKLGQFCRMIRSHGAYPEFKDEISKIKGWTWDIEEEKFSKCFDEIKKFQTKNDKISVPRNHIISIGNYNINLGAWVNTVRTRYFNVNNSEYKSSNVKTLFDDKNDPRIKMFEKLDGWSWSNKPEFPNFKKAKRIVRKMKVSNYKSYCNMLRKENPHNLPIKPFKTYKKQWINLYDYFGIRGVSNIEKSKNKFSYNEAKKYIANNCKGKINSIGKFNLWKNDEIIGIPKFPEKMPKNPMNSYKENWVSNYHFFGEKAIKIKKRDYPHFKYERIEYKKLKEICQKQNFNSGTECSNWLRLNKEYFYKMNLYAPIKGGESYEEFEGWDDFLGKAKNKK